MIDPCSFPIASQNHLLYRLAHAIGSGQKVTFLLGSGLTLPNAEASEPGVPGAADMVNRVRDCFTTPEESADLESLLKESATSLVYQEAMRFMIRCRGQSKE